VPDLDDDEHLAARFDELLRGVDHTQTSTSKYRRFEEFLGLTLGIPPGGIYTTHIAKAGNFDVRMTQSDRARSASFRVALVPSELDLAPVAEQATRLAVERNRGTSVLVVFDSPTGWRPWWGIEPSPENAGAAGRPAGNMSPLEQVRGFRLQRYPYQAAEPPGPGELETSGAIRTPRNPITAIPPIVEPRIRRMLRNAVASSKAIMLVGPPGTGKSTLVEEIVRESAADPAAYGLSYGHDLSVVTPDESWTARDLVGGISIEADGQLKFAPGHVLRAVAADKWLLLDEANRADMDKIFGGLLTWLAGQQVTVGRDAPGSPAEIILSWSGKARSMVEDIPASNGRPAATVYRAGQEWRLLGTYNSLDAHRVFRFGLALGRRFAQIPVPPPTAELFQEIIQQRLEGVLNGETGQRVSDTVARIYEIHTVSRAVAVGPALFLSIPHYVKAGMKPNSGEPGSTEELIAEAYLSAFGTWLARLDDDVLDALGVGMSRNDALGSQWEWVREQLRNLA
jgi:MoxR-like ATPase